ncbi:MAG: periplasmic heavy metal sensor [Gammaproteobacteria bacterium]|nr:periplasmic heavy metal sensor [Gammaproteobacteria bacterium]
MRRSLIVISLAFISASVLAATDHKSKYSGEESRKIKSLSSDDVDELLNGGGWGFAKAAELNGLPGPKHLLEMEDEINLSQEQKAKIEELFREMKGQAIDLGQKLVDLESELNSGFASNSIGEDDLAKLLNRIGEVRAKLRFVHLQAHLQTPEILSTEQRQLYIELRGYSNDPCTNVPKGHDEAMWKKHNNCN